MYYKIVTQDLKSFISQNIYAVQYKVGEFVRPKLLNSKLFVFETMWHLLEFSKRLLNTDLANYYIYSCEINGKSNATYMAYSHEHASLFWDEGILCSIVPCGTVYANEVKLLEKIDWPS